MEKYRFTHEQQALLENMQVPLAVFQLVDKRIVTVALSDGFCELLGAQSREQAYADMDRDTYKDVHPEDVARTANAVFRFMKEGDTFEVVYRLRRKDGPGYRLIHAMGRHVYPEEGVRLAHVWYADEGAYAEEGERKGTELSRALSNAIHEESILRASHYDYLTGLPSMTHFFELAEAGKEAVYREGGYVVFLYLDLNGMKFFNHRYGFAEGDRYLQAFAKLLSATFNSENCCHLGQDHFGAYTREEGLEDTLRRFFREAATLNDGNAMPVRVGIYSTRQEDVPVSSACDRAKIACDALKGAYASAFRYYSQELRDEAVRKQYIIENIDRAIEEKWIRVYYQPIVRAATGQISDDEALSRWIDPVMGYMSPAEFIPALEEAGSIYKLDLYVLEQVLEKLRMLRDRGLHIVPQSINLSRKDFTACDIVEEIRRRVDAAGISRDRITIELTESVIGSDFDFMKEQVARFQALGFPVWMDDFGSGYSSLDVLQSIKFNLLKFDMSFLQKLEEGDSGKIILTELMKMATALGVSTVCEGVETEAHVRFLREIGCSKLQGYYYSKPVPLEHLIEFHDKHPKIGYENPAESAYYEAIGCVNLYDLAVITNGDENSFQNFFKTLPLGIMEIKEGGIRFVRTNQSYRDFIRRFFGIDLSDNAAEYSDSPFGPGSAFMALVRSCCRDGNRAYFDEQMPDGSIVHSFARKIGTNPVTGVTAAAVAVLSITEANEGTTYASIARALAADYYNIYYVDLETDRFIEYSSPVGGEELAMERHGDDFFNASRRAAGRIHEEDREPFYAAFTKENLLRELDEHGVFTATYRRLLEDGTAVYVHMKITRMQTGGRHIIIGISTIDAQMKQKERIEAMQKERDALVRLMALSEDYMSLYAIDPETGRYVEYSASDEYESLGFAKEGEDFFLEGVVEGERTVCADDLPRYLEAFSRENVLRSIRKTGVFKLQYRLVINGEPRPVSLKIARFTEGNREKLVAGVRAWKTRR